MKTFVEILNEMGEFYNIHVTFNDTIAKRPISFLTSLLL